MQKITKELGVLTVVLMSVVGLTACNTIEGAGEDVEAAGSAIDNSAEDANNYSK